MIHSNKSDPREILEFADAYKGLCARLGRRPVLVSVPTTYNTLSDAELVANGFNIIIHANHMLRAAYKAMTEVAATILTGGSSLDANPVCAPVSEIFDCVGHDRITRKDRERATSRRLLNVKTNAGKTNGAVVGSGTQH